jgi:hypothetical protein
VLSPRGGLGKGGFEGGNSTRDRSHGDSSTVDRSGGSSTSNRSGGGTTSQITRVPVGGAATGGGSTSGVENADLLLLGLFLLAMAVPALVRREPARVKA